VVDGNVDAHLQNVVLHRSQLLELFLERQGVDKFNIQEKLGISWDAMEEIVDDDMSTVSPPVTDRILNKATISREDRKILAEVLGGRSSITVTKEIKEKIFCEVVLPEKKGVFGKKQEKHQVEAIPDKTLNKKALPGVLSDMKRKKADNKNVAANKEGEIRKIFEKQLSFVELVNELMPVCDTNAVKMSEAIGKNKSYWAVLKATTGPGKAPYYLSTDLAEKMAKVLDLSDGQTKEFLKSHALYVEKCARKKGEKSVAKVRNKKQKAVVAKVLPKSRAKRAKKIIKVKKIKLSKQSQTSNGSVSFKQLGITADTVLLYIIERFCLVDGKKFADICCKAGIDNVGNVNGNTIQAVVEFIKTLDVDNRQKVVSFLSSLMNLLFLKPITFKIVGIGAESIAEALTAMAQVSPPAS